MSSEEEPGWEGGPEDEWGVAVLTTVGRRLRLRQEAMGMRVADFAVAVKYGYDLVHKVEGGKRISRREYLCGADRLCDTYVGTLNLRLSRGPETCVSGPPHA